MFSFHIDRCLTSEGKEMPRYYVLDFPEWVQVLALDSEGQVIVVEQYRYPGQGYFLELPGGSADGSRTEDPLVAAKRELLEETGYESNDWVYVGNHFANPALQTNRVHIFVAKNCQKTSDLQLDPFEELQVRRMPYKEFEALCMSSEKKHSLMLASLFLARSALD